MKSFLHFIPTHIFVLYSAGVLFQYYFPLFNSTIILFEIVVFCLIGLRLYKYYQYFFCLLVFTFGMLSLQLRNSPVLESQTVKTMIPLVIQDVLKETDYSYSYIALYQNPKRNRGSEKILLRVEKTHQTFPFLIGDELIGYSKIEEVSSKRNPYDFDYKNYLEKQNIKRQVSLKHGRWKRIDGYRFSLKRIAFQLRHKLIGSLTQKIKNKEVLSVSLALLLGERQYISSELQKNYANAGVIHILAVSGLHIGIIVLLLYFIFQPLKRIKHGVIIEFLLIFLLLWSYAFLAGLSPSIVRAVVMFSFISFGRVINRRGNVFHSLITSALILVLVNPFYLFDLGFKMSYIAVFSIVILQPIISRLWKPKNSVIKYLWNLSTVSMSAQLGLLPLSLYYFHQFPGLFIISNLVVLPALGLVLTFGFFVLLLSYFRIDIDVCYQIYSSVVQLLNDFIAWISVQEKWLLENIYFSSAMLLSSYVILFLALGTFYKINTKRLYALGFSVLAFQGVMYYEMLQRKNLEELIIYQQYKKSCISISRGGRLNFYGPDIEKEDKLVQYYVNKTRVTLDSLFKEVPPVIFFQDKKILIIDANAVYKVLNFTDGILVLKDSPKLNLERCIDFVKPNMVIADGSNYPYLKERWKKTCSKYRITFHDTQKDGAFVLK